MQSDNPGIRYHLGLALLRKGETEKALDILRKLVSDINNENEYKKHAKWIIANEYIKEGQYEKAIPILEVLQ